MLDGISYPGFFDHARHRLNGGIVVIPSKVKENAKRGHHTTPRQEVGILSVKHGK